MDLNDTMLNVDLSVLLRGNAVGISIETDYRCPLKHTHGRRSGGKGWREKREGKEECWMDREMIRLESSSFIPHREAKLGAPNEPLRRH